MEGLGEAGGPYGPDARVATEALWSGGGDGSQAAVRAEEAARHRRADAGHDGEHRLGLCGGVARGTTWPFGADGGGDPTRALGEPYEPGGAVVGVEAVEHGEPVLDEPADRAAPGVLGDAWLALEEEDGLRERGLQADGLVEEPAVADGGAEVGRALALDRQVVAEHVVADGQVGQLHVQTGSDER